MDSRIRGAAPVATRPLFDVVVDLDAPLPIGGPLGQRVLFRALGGTFEGERLRGDVVPGGGDWAVFRADGAMVLDVRVTLRTQDGALVQMSYGGRWVIPDDIRTEIGNPATRHLVDPARYYFRTAPLFETGARNYQWLNDIVCVATGYPVENGVAYRVYEVL
ncbi:DUF3237 domain-containing protein [Nocardia otitidiscaviarum]|uniref:DUF3237 domain-containing protein n=1 Tax=Nocardia otitidiscaviarum TaxID=1823 RepID=UPI001E35C4C9|nr:DUF3237 domain-containing protein [Nocardia otitidiscaviarum]